MKTNDILILAGIGLLGWFLYKRNQAANFDPNQSPVNFITPYQTSGIQQNQTSGIPISILGVGTTVTPNTQANVAGTIVGNFTSLPLTAVTKIFPSNTIVNKAATKLKNWIKNL